MREYARVDTAPSTDAFLVMLRADWPSLRVATNIFQEGCTDSLCFGGIRTVDPNSSSFGVYARFMLGFGVTFAHNANQGVERVVSIVSSMLNCAMLSHNVYF